MPDDQKGNAPGMEKWTPKPSMKGSEHPNMRGAARPVAPLITLSIASDHDHRDILLASPEQRPPAC